MRKSLRAFALLGLVAGSATLLAAGNGLMVENPWIREAPPGAAALAGYMVLKNHGDKERLLVEASSPAFGSVMLHRTVMKDGVASMEHQERIAIPAKGEVTFEPNGYHLMLMKPKQALKAGDEVAVTLKFQDGETLDVIHQVRAGQGMAMGHGHDMGGMNGHAMDNGSHDMSH